MRVLLLVMDEQRIILDHLYAMISVNISVCDVMRLNKVQQSHLATVFKEVDYQAYDRIVVFLRLKRLQTQVDVLRCIPGLVFLEHDACQNYMPSSKYHGAYSAFYKLLPWAKVLCSGYQLASRLRQEGVDAVFVSKGYDERLVCDMGRPRDIEVAFIGSAKGRTYVHRREFLRQVGSASNLLVTRTESGGEYIELLNRVRVFISADVGMGEYMVKNFEAMACGCVLLAWSQGEEEDAALGFKDGHNVMLCRSASEALEKLALLRSAPALADRIAREGKAFAESRYTFARIGRDLARAIEAPMRPWPGLSLWQKLWIRVRHGMKI